MSILRKTAAAAVVTLALAASVNFSARADEPAAQEPAAKAAIDESIFEIKDGQDAQYYVDAENKIRTELNTFIAAKPSREDQMKYFQMANDALGKIYKAVVNVEGDVDPAFRLRATVMYGRTLAGEGAVDELQALLAKEKAKSEPNPTIVLALGQFIFSARLNKAVEAKDSQAVQALADEILAKVVDDPSDENAAMFLQFARMIADADQEVGAKLNAAASEKFNASDNKTLKKVAMLLDAKKRFAELVGNEMKVEGVFLDGTEIDWNSYRGKVVLVDFWATWCGPCCREIPNVQAMYEKYHDAGFDVVGYSLDDDLDALEKFEEEKKLPWKTMSNVKSKAYEKKDFVDLADYYGIEAIPTMILVDKDGKVVDKNARGEHLQELLQKAFPDVK